MLGGCAAMEPGERHREHIVALYHLVMDQVAAMEPGERHREHTSKRRSSQPGVSPPQWSPVNVTGNTLTAWLQLTQLDTAAMEPGERHREHASSPTLHTGSITAAMEPGERHREHLFLSGAALTHLSIAAMEPGERHREHVSAAQVTKLASKGRNGAR